MNNVVKRAEMELTSLSRIDRIRGGLYGLLIGDALGVPYECHGALAIPPEQEIEMEPPERFRRAHAGVPIGTWSDNGAQTLCLLDSLSGNATLDLHDLSQRLLSWYETGCMTPDGKVFNAGLQTSRALDALRRDENPNKSGPNTERDNGNGALLRCLPVAFAANSLNEVFRWSMQQSIVTHGHMRSQLCCAFYAVAAAGLLQGMAANEAVAEAENELRQRFADAENESEMQLVLNARAGRSLGSRYVVDSLWSSIDCFLTTTDYEACVRRAIMLGNDTDTTASIAGGLAGVLYGYEAIPHRWRDVLRGKEIVEQLLARF